MKTLACEVDNTIGSAAVTSSRNLVGNLFFLQCDVSCSSFMKYINTDIGQCLQRFGSGLSLVVCQ